ncbi:helix-turn-helix domain-containing protein [Acetobacter indonesiensis]
MIPAHVPAPNAAGPHHRFRPAPSGRLGCPAQGPSAIIDDGRQIDLEEATGRFRANEAAERKLQSHIGKRLRHKRNERGLSMPALGKCSGRSGQQIQKYEFGQNAVKAATLYQLANALGVPMAYFFEGLV